MYKLLFSSTQVKLLNDTVNEMRKHPAFDVQSVKTDLDKIKTGMAETGSSISKLENTDLVLAKKVKGLSERSTKFQGILLNITVSYSTFNIADRTVK